MVGVAVLQQRRRSKSASLTFIPQKYLRFCCYIFKLIIAGMNHNERYNLRAICCGSISFCVCFILISVIFGVIIAALFTRHTSFHQYYIGDVLWNTSTVISASSQIALVIMEFNTPVEGIYLADTMPSIAIYNLPKKQMTTYYGVTFQDYNYIGLGEPIYLLTGSKIIYSTKVIMYETYTLNSTVACILIFDNPTKFANFITYGRHSGNLKKQCFTPANVTAVSWSFDITEEESQYYVGIAVADGVTVASNVSIIRAYYDLSQLSTIYGCVNSSYCTVTMCNTIICNKESESYIIIDTAGSTNISYIEYEAYIYGKILSAFISLLVVYIIVILSLMLCCISCVCIIIRSIKQNHVHRISSEPLIDNDRSSLSSSRSTSSTNLSGINEEYTIELLPKKKQAMWRNLSENKPTISLESKDSCNKCFPNICQCHNAELTKEQAEIPSILSPTHSPQATPSFQSSQMYSEISNDSGQTTETVLSYISKDLMASSEYMSEPYLNLNKFQADHNFPHLANTLHCELVVNDAASMVHVSEDLLKTAKSVFGELQELPVDSSGLVYHNSEYGVTLIIPEGALQQSATVWFGACLYSYKFKFGDYVPVTPIVWVHIDQKLHKCAELHIPHDIAISSEQDLQQFTVLTADDDDYSEEINFQHHSPIITQLNFLQVFTFERLHFCSNCVAAHNGQYKTIAKRYLIARAEKKNENNDLIVEFIFLCQQQGCKKMVEGQCAKKGLTITSYKPVTFTGDGQVSLTIEPDTLIGWKIQYDDLHSEYISAESIDYYQVMGCDDPGGVTQDELERLDVLEDAFSYPPRFKITFSQDKSFEHNNSQEFTVKFNQVHPRITSKILLDGHCITQPLSPPSSHDSVSSDIDSFSKDNDPELGDILHIIASEDYLKENWYTFGYNLNLDTGLLNEIETSCTSTIQCTRKVILYWRGKNKTEACTSGYTTWEPLAVVLVKIGLPDLAHRIKNHFKSPPPEPQLEASLSSSTSNYKGVYCKLCDKIHLNFDDFQQHVPSTICNSPPSMPDLINLVAAKIEDKYHSFGIAVGINDGFLRSLLTDQPNCMDRFIAVLERWKDNDPDKFTWSTVIKVLQSDAIKANEVAQDVMKILAAKTVEQ